MRHKLLIVDDETDLLAEYAQTAWPVSGRLRWLAADDAPPAVDLQAEGHHLKWGK